VSGARAFPHGQEGHDHLGVRTSGSRVHALHTEREPVVGPHIRQHGASARVVRVDHVAPWRAYQWLRVAVSVGIGVLILIVTLIELR
jgi:hypothetical protein